jgi:DNA-directed RNA polymerase specialized sigma subunit
MQAEEYLEQVKKADVRVHGLRFEIERLEDLSKNLSSKSFENERVMSSGNQDRVANITTTLMDKKERYRNLVDASEKKREDIINQIYSLKDLTSSQILFFVYIENKSYHDVARELNYSYDHVRRLYRKAIRDFNKECVF